MTTAHTTTLGAIFLPDLPPERLQPVARAADRAGLEQLWLWEDCFKESGIAPAAAALAWTERLTIGIGLMPVPLRNVAVTAMEIATIERLFPGRFRPGVGHGVLEWMGWLGVRAESPMTLLLEYTDALRQLLQGATVNADGRYVHLEDVTLDWPPAVAPPVYVGAKGPKTVALAGGHGDGVIFTDETTPEQLRESARIAAEAASAAGRATPDNLVFVLVDGRPSAAEVAARVAEFVDAGATEIALQPHGDALPAEEFVEFVATEVRPLVP
ncbi:LLM class flavin-dependent oxidoreductase [Jatrophihabitans sp. YIM 134969]